MNQEVNGFTDFVLSKLTIHSNAITDEIQQYMDQWDNSGFDTEETYYIIDTLRKVMAMVDVDIHDIVI